MALFQLPASNRDNLLIALQFISIGLLYTPNGVGWYIGNLLAYLNSYWHSEQGATTFMSQWVMSIFIIATCSSVIVGGSIIQKVDTRIISLLGVVFFDLGLFTSFYTVKCSQVVFVMAFGGLTGIGYGFIQVEVMTRISTLLTKRVGMGLAMMNNFMNVGTVFYDWLITFYTNPDGAQADMRVSGNYAVFSDQSVIDRVPSLFLVLGLLTSGSHFSGLILSVVLHGRYQKEDADQMTAFDDNNIVTGTEKVESTSLIYDADGIARKNVSQPYEARQFSYHSCSGSSVEGSNMSQKIHDEREYNSIDLEKPGDKTCTSYTDLRPIDMIKTPNFYLLWFALFASDTAYVFLLNFYKVFGELWIEDDYFLTRLGMSFLFVVIIMRFLWADSMDRFGVKNTHIILNTSLALGCAFYYFTPQLNKWLFACLTCFMSSLCSGVYLIYNITALKLFGQTHFASNYGWLISSVIVLNLLAPSISQFLLSHFGWSGIFLFTSAINTVALVVNVLGLREV